MKCSRLLLFCIIALPTLSPAAWDIRAGWESQYISEGRRALDESGGLFTGTLVYEEGPWFAEAWNGMSTSADFRELDASLGRVFQWGVVEFSTGYTLVKTWKNGDGEKPDHEWFLGAGRPLTETTEVSVDLVYGHLSRGSYIECGLSQALPAPEGFSWSVFGAVAWDFGYASDAFDGISHAHVGTEVDVPFGPDWFGAVFFVLTLPFEDLEQDGGSSTGSVGFSVGREF